MVIERLILVLEWKESGFCFFGFCAGLLCCIRGRRDVADAKMRGQEGGDLSRLGL